MQASAFDGSGHGDDGGESLDLGGSAWPAAAGVGWEELGEDVECGGGGGEGEGGGGGAARAA